MLIAAGLAIFTGWAILVDQLGDWFGRWYVRRAARRH